MEKILSPKKTLLAATVFLGSLFASPAAQADSCNIRWDVGQVFRWSTYTNGDLINYGNLRIDNIYGSSGDRWEGRQLSIDGVPGERVDGAFYYTPGNVVSDFSLQNTRWNESWYGDCRGSAIEGYIKANDGRDITFTITPL